MGDQSGTRRRLRAARAWFASLKLLERIGLAIALVSLLVGVYALGYTVGDNSAEERLASRDDRIAELENQVTRREKQISDLRDHATDRRNDTPAAQVSEASGSEPSVTPSSAAPSQPSAGNGSRDSSPSGDPERFRGSIRLADGNSIDFDHERPRPRDPAFAEVTYEAANDVLALHVSRGGTPAFALWNDERDPTRDECEELIDTQTLSPEEEDIYQPEEGLGICIETFGENLVVFLRVASRQSDALMADVVVWAEPSG